MWLVKNDSSPQDVVRSQDMTEPKGNEPYQDSNFYLFLQWPQITIMIFRSDIDHMLFYLCEHNHIVCPPPQVLVISVLNALSSGWDGLGHCCYGAGTDIWKNLSSGAAHVFFSGDACAGLDLKETLCVLPPSRFRNVFWAPPVTHRQTLRLPIQMEMKEQVGPTVENIDQRRRIKCCTCAGFLWLCALYMQIEGKEWDWFVWADVVCLSDGNFIQLAHFSFPYTCALNPPSSHLLLCWVFLR